MEKNNSERKYELALFEIYFEGVKNKESGTTTLRDSLRANMKEECADGVLACMVMQSELRRLDYENLEKIYDEAKPIAETLGRVIGERR